MILSMGHKLLIALSFAMVIIQVSMAIPIKNDVDEAYDEISESSVKNEEIFLNLVEILRENGFDVRESL